MRICNLRPKIHFVQNLLVRVILLVNIPIYLFSQLTDVGKFLEKQSAMPYLQDCVALEYYEDSLSAALPRDCLMAQKQERGRSFSLHVPLALPAEITTFLGKHPELVKHLKEEAKSLHVALQSSTGAGGKLGTRAFVLKYNSFRLQIVHCAAERVLVYHRRAHVQLLR